MNAGLRAELSGNVVGLVFTDAGGRLAGVTLCTTCAPGAWHTLEIAAIDNVYLHARFDGERHDSPPGLLPRLRVSQLKLGTGFDSARRFSGEIADANVVVWRRQSAAFGRSVDYALRLLLSCALLVYAFADRRRLRGLRAVIRRKVGQDPQLPRHLGTVVACGLLLRVIYLVTYRPWWNFDSGGYTIPYLLWLRGFYSDGARTPGYPLFLAWAQGIVGTPISALSPTLSAPAAYLSVALQSLTGLLSACLLYGTLRLLRVRARLAWIAALFFALLGGVCEFETFIATQSLSLFSLALGSYLAVKVSAEAAEGRSSRVWPVLTGLAIGWSVLVRSENLVFFAGLLALVLLLRLRVGLARRHQTKALGRACLLAMLTAAPVILSWMAINDLAIGRFRMTTLIGGNMTRTVYNLFDQVDPRDRAIGQVLTGSYRLRNQGGKIARDHYCLAMDDLVDHSGAMPLGNFHRRYARGPSRNYTNPLLLDLGEYMGEVSLDLIRRHPGAWLRNVADNFFRDAFEFHYGRTFKFDYGHAAAGGDWQFVDGRSVIRNRGTWKLTVWTDSIQAPLLLIAYGITIGWALFGSALLLAGRKTEDQAGETVAALGFAAVGMILVCCIFQGFNAEYTEPYVPVFLVCATYTAERLLQRFGVGTRLRTPAAGEVR